MKTFGHRLKDWPKINEVRIWSKAPINITRGKMATGWLDIGDFDSIWVIWTKDIKIRLWSPKGVKFKWDINSPNTNARIKFDL